MVNINSIEGIESLIDKRIKPLKKEILKLRFELEELNKALTIPVVVKSFICRDCEKHSKEYRDNLCEPCHKWHTDS